MSVALGSIHNTGAYAAQSGGYPTQNGGYAAHYNGPVRSGSVSVPGVGVPPHSMPAHFMVPHPPYSDARMDPPGAAVSSRHTLRGRPAASWAVVLAVFGLFVGVGTVAVMNGNDDAGLLETSASFVDPARANGPKAVAAAPSTLVPSPSSVPIANAVVATPAEQPVGVPPVVVPPPAPVPPETVAAPTPAVPVLGAPEVAAAAARPAAAETVASPAPARPAVAAVARAPRSAEEPVAAATPTPRSAKPPRPPGKGSGDSAVDEEQRKALKALQESQLETPF